MIGFSCYHVPSVSVVDFLVLYFLIRFQFRFHSMKIVSVLSQAIGSGLRHSCFRFCAMPGFKPLCFKPPPGMNLVTALKDAITPQFPKILYTGGWKYSTEDIWVNIFLGKEWIL